MGLGVSHTWAQGLACSSWAVSPRQGTHLFSLDFFSYKRGTIMPPPKGGPHEDEMRWSN